jgi:transposase-like protein
MKKHYRTAPEVREQILKRIKEEGISVEQAAKDAGVHNTTIYGWTISVIAAILRARVRRAIAMSDPSWYSYLLAGLTN